MLYKLPYSIILYQIYGCVFAVVVYLALYGIYVLVVVFGRVVYQYQKRKAAQNVQQRSVNRVDTDGNDASKSLLYSQSPVLGSDQQSEFNRHQN